MIMVNKNLKPAFIFTGLTIVILWQMLIPGYVLTLDMIFTPNLKSDLPDGAFYNSLPLLYFLKFINLFLSGWIIQKGILISLFFCIGYLAYKFLPVPQKYHANYWAALFYTINPFVYERFLAGHWQHLFAYAFLPPFIFYLLKLAKELNWQNSAGLFGWLFLIGVFSLHFLVMAILILTIYLSCQILKNLIIKNKKRVIDIIKFTSLSSLFFLIISGYWLIPYFFNREQAIINNFTLENLEAFKTAGDFRLGTSLNVMTLYGFWGESQPWANYWLWPKDWFIFWLTTFTFLFALICSGIIYGFIKEQYRNQAIFFLLLALLAFIFSCGIGDTIFKSNNQWLFEHIFFWRGFRDSQKWNGLLTLSYAYFGGLGLTLLIENHKIYNKKFQNLLLAIIFTIPLLYTYPMLGGFARQLQPVWYPKSWGQVNQLLNQDNTNYKVLFLPWHQYLSLKFNHNLITANPALLFFDQELIQSQNIEIGNLFNQDQDQKNIDLTNLMKNEDQWTPDQIIDQLKGEKMKYIIFIKDLIGQDIFDYKFLNSSGLWKTFDSPEIILYQIQDF